MIYIIFKIINMNDTNMSVDTSISFLYALFQKHYGSLGGGASPDEPIYGELTLGSMNKIFTYLKDNCSLDERSMFIDIGSGLGKPTLHCANFCNCLVSIGIEIAKLRYLMSMQILLRGLQSESIYTTGVSFINENIENAYTLDPFTHVYVFDDGFPPKTIATLARQFNLR